MCNFHKPRIPKRCQELNSSVHFSFDHLMEKTFSEVCTKENWAWIIKFTLTFFITYLCSLFINRKIHSLYTQTEKKILFRISTVSYTKSMVGKMHFFFFCQSVSAHLELRLAAKRWWIHLLLLACPPSLAPPFFLLSLLFRNMPWTSGWSSCPWLQLGPNLAVAANEGSLPRLSTSVAWMNEWRCGKLLSC